MSVRIVRLGSPRAPGEGLRIGTVRRPPRGVPKAQYGSGNWYDVWFPILAPSAELVQFARNAASDKEWNEFARRYKAEMAQPDPRHAIELLAALSHTSEFAVGCYCPEESRCHRSLLRALLEDAGAIIATGERDS